MEDIEKQYNEKGEEIVVNPFYEAMVDDYHIYMENIDLLDDKEKLNFYFYVINRMSRPVNLDDKYWLMALSLEDHEIVQRYLLGSLTDEYIQNNQETKCNDASDVAMHSVNPGTLLVKRIVRKFKSR